MFTEIVLLAVMAVLYGLAWHNEPAKAQSNQSRTRNSPGIQPKSNIQPVAKS